MSRSFLRMTLSVVVACGLVGGSADAAILTATYLGHSTFNSNPIFGNSNVQVDQNGGGTHFTSQGGAFSWDKTVDTLSYPGGASLAVPPPGFGPAGTDLVTYCMSLTGNISSGSNNFSSATAAGNAFNWLWQEHFVDAVASRDGAGAFQLAIWELLYGVGGGAGQLVLTSVGAGGATVIADAATWAAAALAHGSDTTGLTTFLVVLHSAGGQDQLAPLDTSADPFVSVPEPASMAVWGVLALAGVAFARRRKMA